MIRRIKRKRGRKIRIEAVPTFKFENYDASDIAKENPALKFACDCLIHNIHQAMHKRITAPGIARDLQKESEKKNPT